jgi:putative ABC transport system permease protein
MQALREIKRNIMRSLLTAIGIVIGIASVIAMVNIGKSASLSITKSVSKLGSNVLFIMPGQHNGPGGISAVSKPFKSDTVALLKNSILTLSAVSPVENASMTVIYKNQNYKTNIKGVNDDYFLVQNWHMKMGRKFDKRELRSGQNVCILGETVVKNLLLNTQTSLGKRISMKDFSCEVIGVLSEKGANTFGIDQDDVVFVPIKMFQRRISGNDNFHLIMASVKKKIPLQEASLQIEQLLREKRHLKSNDDSDFSVKNMTALLDTISKVTSMLTMMLGSIAAISLIVGGIGIMNIMLVSVTERTREIGVRMAVGAMAKDILIQFLIESVVLSSLGGITGIIIGILITYIASYAFHIAFIIEPAITIVALLFSMAIGIIFGIVPARKAANMNPIDALRYE